MIHRIGLALVLVFSGTGLGVAELPGRWMPERCVELFAETPHESAVPETESVSFWNAEYRAGWEAIQREAYVEAESEMCRALFAAREFDPRDWRFAETLDELGLIAFELRDFAAAERFQGAAIAEMLLAVGPHGEPFKDTDASAQSPVRPDCRSGLGAYTTRLGWIHEQTRGRIATDDLEDEPWRIFAAGYVPLDANLAGRLDWLIGRYLLEENLAAAGVLTELQATIRDAAPDARVRPSRVISEAP